MEFVAVEGSFSKGALVTVSGDGHLTAR